MNSSPAEQNHASEHPTLSSALLQDVQRMEPSAWSRLVATFGPIVYRWCRTSGVCESDSPDVVQEVFVSVARGIVNFEREKTEGSFRSWLATITRNKVRDYFRRQAKQLAGEGGTEAMVRLQSQAEDLNSTICADGIQSRLVRETLEQVRAEFEPKTWQAFWLTTIEEKTASEVAEITSLAIASVYQSKSRVLRRLRQRIEELPQ